MSYSKEFDLKSIKIQNIEHNYLNNSSNKAETHSTKTIQNDSSNKAET